MRLTACAILLVWACLRLGAQPATPQRSDDIGVYQTGYCPQTSQLATKPSQKLWLDGAIGKQQVRMFLDRGGSGVVGLFYAVEGNWDPTLLGGKWDEHEIEISDSTPGRASDGTLKAVLRGKQLTGSWLTGSGGHSEPVALAVVSEPECEGRGPWKHFDDPALRVSFSYPASWHLEQSPKSITLTCPNAEEIAYNRHVTIYAGSGSPKGPTDVVQCGGTWRYGAVCDCSQNGAGECRAAKMSRRETAMVLDVSDREWRVYCNGGGYVAQGDGEDRIVLLPDRWVEITADGDLAAIMDQLVGTVVVSPPSGSKSLKD